MSWLQKLLTLNVFNSLLRKLLAVLSGWLLATIPDVGAETIAQFIQSLALIIQALIPILVSVIWSLINKAKSK